MTAAEVLAALIDCSRHRARLSEKACSRRAAWDSQCAGCERGKPLKAYGKFRCSCGRSIKKEGACWLCSRDRSAPIASPEGAAKVGKERGYRKCIAHTNRRAGRPLAACAKCGVVTQISARGLGDNCYRQEKLCGTLDVNYPARGPQPLKDGCKEKPSGTPCAKCGVTTKVLARGLGSLCYMQEQRAGTLDANYPAKRKA